VGNFIRRHVGCVGAWGVSVDASTFSPTSSVGQHFTRREKYHYNWRATDADSCIIAIFLLVDKVWTTHIHSTPECWRKTCGPPTPQDIARTFWVVWRAIKSVKLACTEGQFIRGFSLQSVSLLSTVPGCSPHTSRAPYTHSTHTHAHHIHPHTPHIHHTPTDTYTHHTHTTHKHTHTHTTPTT